MKSKNYFPADFFQDNGQTINLRSLEFEANDPSDPCSPYLLNLKPKQEEKTNLQPPNLLNLKIQPENIFGESFAPASLLTNNIWRGEYKKEREDKPPKNSRVKIFTHKKGAAVFLWVNI